MRIIALLSWYEESPRWLTEMVESLAKLQVDHLVALDGAYALYPGATAQSRPEQGQAIQRACEQAGIGCDVHTVDEPFAGNEVEKRSRLFELGNEVATPNEDWFLIVDADELVANAPLDTRERLEQTDFDVAQVMFHEPSIPEGPARHFRWQRKPYYPLRIFFRAIPGLTLRSNHFTYITPDGRKLWGPATRSLEPALDLRDFEILHRSDQRVPARRVDQLTYYENRDSEKVELGYCERCSKMAVKSMPYKWEPSPEGLVADWMDLCAKHAKEAKRENARTLRGFGLDPETMRPDPQLAVAQ